MKTRGVIEELREIYPVRVCLVALGLHETVGQAGVLGKGKTRIEKKLLDGAMWTMISVWAI